MRAVLLTLYFIAWTLSIWQYSNPDFHMRRIFPERISILHTCDGRMQKAPGDHRDKELRDNDSSFFASDQPGREY